MEEKTTRKFKGNNLIWILFLVIALYEFLSQGAELLVMAAARIIFKDASPAVMFVNEYYTPTIGAILVLVLVCLIVKKNRFILRSFLPKGVGKDHKILVVEDTYEATQENTAQKLLIGLLLGFLTNFACILCAMIHGDIKLYLDVSASMIPVFIYAFIMVFIQSTSEELWCRVRAKSSGQGDLCMKESIYIIRCGYPFSLTVSFSACCTRSIRASV